MIFNYPEFQPLLQILGVEGKERLITTSHPLGSVVSTCPCVLWSVIVVELALIRSLSKNEMLQWVYKRCASFIVVITSF